jgi:O-antigen/teichoic acid export membrane protein
VQGLPPGFDRLHLGYYLLVNAMPEGRTGGNVGVEQPPAARRKLPSVSRQAILTFFGQSSGYVVAVLTGILVARTLGPAGKGIISYASLLLTIFTTYGNGLQNAMMYQCGRNGEKQVLVYGASLRIIGAVMVPIWAVLFTIGILVPSQAPLAYIACAIPFAVYGQVAMGIFFLENDIGATIVQAAFNTFGFALATVPALLFWHANITTVLGIWAAMYFAAAVFAMIRLNRYLPAWNTLSTMATVREQAWFGLKAGSVSVADFLNLRIDIFVVGIMLDARALGIYSLAVATGEMMWQVSRPLTWTTIGRIASSEREHSIGLVTKVARNILAFELLLGIVMFAFAPAAVNIVYGKAYAESGMLVRWLLPGLILYAAHGGLGYFVMVREGRTMPVLAIQVTSVVACAAITALTLPRFGLVGAALATSITYGFCAVAKALLFMHYTGTSLRTLTILKSQDLQRLRAFAGARL